MKCAACGAELAEGTKFCTQCGHTVDGANVVDQGSGYGQGTSYQQGTDYGYQQDANYGQGTGYQQGANYGQGTGYQQGANYGQGTGYQQGANYGQETGYQQGANYGQGTSYQQGANYGQGAGYQQGSGYQQGTGYNYNAGAGYSYNQGAGYNQGMPYEKVSKKEFYKLPGVKTCRTNIRTCAILAYVCSGFTIFASLLLSDYLASSIIDGLLLLGLGLGVQLARSRVCAIILAGYGLLNMAIALVSYGTVQGWLIPVIGIYAIIYTFKYQKMWENYDKNGIMP